MLIDCSAGAGRATGSEEPYYFSPHSVRPIGLNNQTV